MLRPEVEVPVSKWESRFMFLLTVGCFWTLIETGIAVWELAGK